METLGGDYIKHEQYHKLFILAGIALKVIILAFAFKNRIERLLGKIHIVG